MARTKSETTTALAKAAAAKAKAAAKQKETIAKVERLLKETSAKVTRKSSPEGLAAEAANVAATACQYCLKLLIMVWLDRKAPHADTTSGDSS